MVHGSVELAIVGAGEATGPEVEPARDCGLAGLILLAQFHGIAADASQLRHEFASGGEPFDETTLLLAAKRLGL